MLVKRSTGEIVHRGLRYELMPVSMLISAAVSFCLLLKGVELLILRPTRHTGAMENNGVFLRYSYSSGLILPLLASDTPVRPSDADALGFLRAQLFGVGDGVQVRCT